MFPDESTTGWEISLATLNPAGRVKLVTASRPGCIRPAWPGYRR